MIKQEKICIQDLIYRCNNYSEIQFFNVLTAKFHSKPSTYTSFSEKCIQQYLQYYVLQNQLAKTISNTSIGFDVFFVVNTLAIRFKVQFPTSLISYAKPLSMALQWHELLKRKLILQFLKGWPIGPVFTPAHVLFCTYILTELCFLSSFMYFILS